VREVRASCTDKWSFGVTGGFPTLRGTLTVSSILFALCASLSQPASANCENIPAGKSFWVRLRDPVATYSSKPGATVRAVLIQSPECNGAPVFPAGLEVDGQIARVQKVGLGFVHDSAAVEVQFDRFITTSGMTLPIASRVVEIDNSRETVRRGVIHGVRATDTPQGRITSRLAHLPTFNPYTDWGLIVYRAFFTILPEPEIYLPPGTDLRLQLNVPLYVGDQPEIPRASFQLDEFERGDVEMLLENIPDRTTTPKGKSADLVNILLVGSREQVQSAFTAAGWRPSDNASTHSVLREFGAFLTFSNYPTEPISIQWLNGQPQELAFQKSFDSYAKREHLRLWSEPSTVLGQSAWLSAYTRETGAALSLKNHKFIHRIDRNLDDGVNMLVRDLTLAGCVEAVRQLPRPELQQLMVNATGDEMYTDGNLTVVHLRSCDRPGILYSRLNPIVPVHPRYRAVRYLRSQVLVYKSDVIRGNLVYSAFDLTRMSIHTFRHRHDSPDELDEGLPLSPVSPDTLFPQLNLGGIPLGK
jgi:hypothetical protein